MRSADVGDEENTTLSTIYMHPMHVHIIPLDFYRYRCITMGMSFRLTNSDTQAIRPAMSHTNDSSIDVVTQTYAGWYNGHFTLISVNDSFVEINCNWENKTKNHFKWTLLLIYKRFFIWIQPDYQIHYAIKPRNVNKDYFLLKMPFGSVEVFLKEQNDSPEIGQIPLTM